MTMDQKNALIEQICVAARILPVITIGSEEQILPLADALSAVACVLWRLPCARVMV